MSSTSGPAPVREDQLPKVDIKPLLSRLWPVGHPDPVSADEIAEAISYFFTNQVSDVQAGALLMCLHFTGLDRQADVLQKTAAAMLRSAAKIDSESLRAVVERRGRKEGDYHGGLVCFSFTHHLVLSQPLIFTSSRLPAHSPHPFIFLTRPLNTIISAPFLLLPNPFFSCPPLLDTTSH